MLRSLVGSEMCIRDRVWFHVLSHVIVHLSGLQVCGCGFTYCHVLLCLCLGFKSVGMVSLTVTCYCASVWASRLWVWFHILSRVIVPLSGLHVCGCGFTYCHVLLCLCLGFTSVGLVSHTVTCYCASVWASRLWVWFHILSRVIVPLSGLCLLYTSPSPRDS